MSLLPRFLARTSELWNTQRRRKCEQVRFKLPRGCPYSGYESDVRKSIWDSVIILTRIEFEEVETAQGDQNSGRKGAVEAES